MSDSLPDDVQTLLRAHVESYEHLVVLLLTHRESKRDWSVEELAAALKTPAQLIEAAVTGLRIAGLLQIASGASAIRYRYSANTATDATIARLAHQYSENPAGVARLLSTNAIERVRTSAVRAFADAFVLKKKDHDRG